MSFTEENSIYLPNLCRVP